MTLKALCPNDKNHKTFITAVSQVNDWKVDKNGNFLSDLGCTSSSSPNKNGNWVCFECGAEAIVLPNK